MRRRLRPLRARATIAHLCAWAVCAALGRGTLAADLYYMGAQYTPGVGYPAPWPTDGSWFDTNLWQNNTLPTSTTNAIFGYDQTMPNGNTTHAPHTLYFGNFGYCDTTTITGGTATLAAATLLSDNWTFDLGSGQNPEFTGTLTPTVGSLALTSLTLGPVTGQSASLTLQSGTFTASSIRVASQSGTALLTLNPATTLASASINIGIGGLGGIGSLVQNGGTNTTGTLCLGTTSGSSGVYVLTDGSLTLTSTLYVGYYGSGTFTQSGGSVQSGGLSLGLNGGPGTYSLSNGLLKSSSATLGSNSAFVQTGGTHTLTRLDVRGFTGAATYTLSDGLLSASYVTLGYYGSGATGTGTFTQTGGTHTISTSLELGYSTLTADCYNLSNGTLTTVSESIGGRGSGSRGTGIFTQTGGTHTISYALDLGSYTGGPSTFSLSAGVLTVGAENLGTYGSGTFTQTGGTHTISFALNIGTLGLMSLTGGTLQLSGSMTNAGSLVLGGNTTFNATGLVDLTRANLSDISNVTVNLAPKSLLLLPAGDLHFAALNNPSGLIFQEGRSTTIPTGFLADLGAKSLRSTIYCAGTLTTVGTLTGEVHLQSPAAKVTFSTLNADTTATSDMTGGQLKVETEYLGNAGTATFTQTDGIHYVTAYPSGVLFLGNTVAGSGFYTLGGGQLIANTEYVGYAGQGTFTQTGGTHTVSQSLVLGSASTATGVYALSDGVLTVSSESLSHSATFIQTGGTHTVSNGLGLGYGCSYALSNGQLATASSGILGTFTQTGGTHTVSGSLTLGYSPSNLSGTYSLASGFLSAASEFLRGAGTFTQTGGTHVNSAGFSIDSNGLLSVTGGTLQLDAGLLNTGSLVLGGTATLVAAGLVDLGHATCQDLSQVTVTLAANSLLILPPQSPATAFGTFINNGGLVAPSGSPITIPAGALVTAGNGGCRDMLLCAGTLSGSAKLYGGIQVQGAGAVATLDLLQFDAAASSISGGQLTVATEYVGYSGSGRFAQTGGTHTVTSQLYVGFMSGAAGTYTLSDGLLSTKKTSVAGANCTGTFIQTGGTHTTSGGLSLSTSVAGTAGTYSLSNGLLAVDSERLGFTSRFTQTGGTHTITHGLEIGYNTGPTPIFELSGGVLTVGGETLGSFGVGTFTQTGGTHTVNSLSIAAGSLFKLTGGTLVLGSLSTNDGSLVLGGTVSITTSSLGLVDLSKAVLLDVSQVSITHNSTWAWLFLPKANFGTISSVPGSFIFQQGRTTVIPNLKVLDFTDRSFGADIDCAGTITGTGTLTGGLLVRGTTGRVTFNTLRAEDAFSGITGGSLSLTSQYVGYSATGTFTQTGGYQTLSGTLCLGYSPTATGSYALNDGQLYAPTSILAYSGKGNFTQGNGYYGVGGTLYAGYNVGSAGTYTLNNGTISVRNEYLGYSGAASFAQNGGIHMLLSGSLILGNNAGGAGSYSLSNGQLTASNEYLGYSGSASFTQTGGTHAVNGPLYVGYNTASTGSYALSAGTLTPSLLYLGATGAGTFTQTGGTHTVGSTLCLGNNTGGVGYYSLKNGQLLSNLYEYVGYSGIGTFTQAGGSHTSKNLLSLGYNTGAAGRYSLSDGLITAATEYVGYSGTGTFTQTGGSHSIGYLYLANNAGAVGVYTLSNGLLQITSAEHLGYSGAGNFAQTGGTHSISGSLMLGEKSGAAGTYTLSKTGVLTTPNLYVGGSSTAGGVGTLAISGGTATVTNTLWVWNTSGTTLTLSGGTLAVANLTLVNPYKFSWTAGTLLITGTSSAITVPTAGVLKANAILYGTLTNNGTVAPGNSLGLLTVQGKYIQSAAATLELEIAGDTPTDYDRLKVTGTSSLSLAGTIDINFLPSYTPAPGDTFDFLDWASTFTDNGYRFNFTHAPLPQGLAWDTSNFSTTGQLTIIAAPEPTSLILLSLGSLSLVQRRRRVPRLCRTQLVPCRRRTEP